MLSILSWKAPSDIPGGRINTISWRLVCCNFFGTNGNDETRIWPLCCVCPIKRVVYRTMWQWLLLDRWIRSVSRRALFCSSYFRLICIIYKICIYFAYDTYIFHICTCSGLRMPWTLISLLSNGIAGKPKEAYDVSWYSYRKRAILSGSTESTAYLPISLALPCRIISHLKAW